MHPSVVLIIPSTMFCVMANIRLKTYCCDIGVFVVWQFQCLTMWLLIQWYCSINETTVEGEMRNVSCFVKSLVNTDEVLILR